MGTPASVMPSGDATVCHASVANGKATDDDLLNAIHHGAVLRVRPKAMTVAVIVAGLVPIMVGAGTGSEVMRRSAAPMVGGMASATVLTLVVIPVLYALIEGRRLGRADR